MSYFLMFLMCLTATFLILLVLIQRGRGGGLAGAFGGMGGQSAFGTKAGDVFTRVTIVTAAFWILLCAVSVKVFSSSDNRLSGDLGGDAPRTESSTAAEKSGPAGSGSRDQGTGAPNRTGTPAGSTKSADGAKADKATGPAHSDAAPAGAAEKATSDKPAGE